MNRHERRRLVAQLRPTLPPAENGAVRLEGGPMAGWVVAADAPALKPTWWMTWPVDVALRSQPGQYVVTGQTGRWVTHG